MNYYRFHGLTLATPFTCPELLPSAAPADVTAELATVDGQDIAWHEQGLCYKASPNRYLLEVPGIARYFLADGKRITIETCTGADEDAVRLFLYNDLAAVLLMQRGMLVLKSSAVEREGKAYLLVGRSAAGKSLAAAGLEKRGFRLVTDNVCALSGQRGTIEVMPGPPFLLLWQTGLELLSRSADGLKPARRGMHKFFVPAAGRGSDKLLPVAGICLLQGHNREDITMMPHTGADKVFCLLGHQYRPPLSHPLGVADKVNELAVRTARSAAMATMHHPLNDDLFDASIDALARHLS